ncbi:MAG: HDIG domain-containing metalloprotein [Bacillota bacterium]
MMWEKVDEWLRRSREQAWYPRGIWRRLGLAFAMYLVFFIILATSIIPHRLNLQAGLVAPLDVVAPRTTIDRLETERRKQEAAAAVAEVYQLDTRILATAQHEIRDLFAAIGEVVANPQQSVTEKTDQVQSLSGLNLSTAVFRSVATSSVADLEEMAEAAVGILGTVMEGGIKAEGLENARTQLARLASGLNLSAFHQEFVRAVTQGRLQRNLIFDAEETARRRQAAMDAVEPAMIPKGMIVLRKGDVVTDWHIVVLQDLGLQRTSTDLLPVTGLALMVTGLLGLLAFYLIRFHPQLVTHESRIAMLGLIITMTLLMTKALGFISGFFAPVAAASMLISHLLDPQVAIVVTVILSASVGFMFDSQLGVAAVALLGGLTAVLASHRTTQRTDLMRNGFIIGLVNLMAIIALRMLERSSPVELATVREAIWGLLNGLLSAVLTIGTLPFFESFFGIVTPVKLLELSNPNQPLLRRLLTEAPGTYYHSLVVGNLAEAATEVVGGHSLLARVGAYYHDVGKLRRPPFFIDNQTGVENPHDKITPSLSAIIITSHVRDGVDMAEQARLPQQVVDIIRQHHGTTLVSYFYSRATEDSNGQEVVEDEFRYDGPKPQTKEAAIVMLADGVEAAVRSLVNPTREKIEETVKKIIRARLNDGQLDNCALTLKDLDLIGDEFLRVLGGIFHPRIEYPDQVVEEMKGKGNSRWR